MIFRNFKQTSTGRWLNVVNTFEKADPQNTPAATHRDQIALAWGLVPADVEVVDGPTDVRTGILLQGPVIVPPLDPAIAIAAAAVDVVTEIDKAFTVRSTKLTDTEKTAMRDKVVALIAKAQGR